MYFVSLHGHETSSWRLQRHHELQAHRVQTWNEISNSISSSAGVPMRHDVHAQHHVWLRL